MSEYCRTIQIKRGSASTFQSENPVLESGELAWEKDSNKIKIGDGTTTWNNLPYLNNEFEINDVLIFKGTLGSGGTITNLPSIYETGWSYKVITAGTYAGKVCEVGDLIISIQSRPPGVATDNDWIVVQSNIDGAVTSLGGTTNKLAKFSSDLVIEDTVISESGGIVNVSGVLNVNSVNVSVSGHNHVVSDITDFNTSVSGLLPTIANSGDNRVLTSTGTSTGVNAETNLTFDGTLLSVSGNFVANSGSLDRLIFNTSLGDPTLNTAQLAWNPSEGTVDLGVSNTYAMHLGEELHYRVRNNTGSTLAKGTPVYASGVTPGGNPRIEVAPFTADGLTREVRFMGLVTENINTGVNGYTTHFGYIRGIDTRGDYAANGDSGKLWASGEPSWSEGDILYPHPTVAGKLTKVEPKHSISVAIILNRHQTQGKIFVRPTSYGHLDDNHDVNVSGVTDGQFLQYNSSTDYWVPSSSGNFSSLQLNGTVVSVSGHSHVTNDITNFNTSVSGLLPTITNSGDNRLLTNDGTSTGINAENNLNFNVDELYVAGNNPSITFRGGANQETYLLTEGGDFVLDENGDKISLYNLSDNVVLTISSDNSSNTSEINSVYPLTLSNSVNVSGIFVATSGSFTQRLDAPLSYFTVSPAVSGTINDWDPGSVADVIRASGSARINGLVDTYGADAVLLYNVGTSGDITLTHASGTANNQFLVPWLGDYVLSTNGGAALIVRDKVDNKWRIT